MRMFISLTLPLIVVMITTYILLQNPADALLRADESTKFVEEICTADHNKCNDRYQQDLCLPLRSLDNQLQPVVENLIYCNTKLDLRDLAPSTREYNTELAEKCTTEYRKALDLLGIRINDPLAIAGILGLPAMYRDLNTRCNDNVEKNVGHKMKEKML